MQGYDGIKNKLYEQEVERTTKYASKQTQKNQQEEQRKREVLDQRKQAQDTEMAAEDKPVDKPIVKDTSMVIKVGETSNAQETLAEPEGPTGI
mmetsp:Transcript_33433/g.51326  ORF Transcript_33433/g.51326 Transcript_33433/m.51326 type:complete len:93 (-) Transcript_33433:2736-3014(-)